jgi:hypothetical protein
MRRKGDIPQERGEQQLNGCIALGLRSDTPGLVARTIENSTQRYGKRAPLRSFCEFHPGNPQSRGRRLRFWDDIHVCEGNRIKTNRSHKQ